MNKQELITSISAKTEEISKKDIESIINALTETITTELQNGGEVAIPNFGKFSVTERAERMGRNPATGQDLLIPASKAPKFKASSVLKKSLN